MVWEISFQDPSGQAGLPLYAAAETTDDRILRNGTTLETLDPAHWATYVIPLLDLGGGLYVARFPADAPAASYYREVFFRAGADPDPADGLVGTDYPDPLIWPPVFVRGRGRRAAGVSGRRAVGLRGQRVAGVSGRRA
jgi:hypothetical protein